MDVSAVATSPTLTAILRGILVNPADITARLVYADALDEHDQPERAELIRVQVEMGQRGADIDTDPERRTYLRRRESSIHGSGSAQSWRSLPWGMSSRVDWDNGMLYHISCTTTQFLTHAPALFAAHPITSVTLTGREPATGGMTTRENFGWWMALVGFDDTRDNERDTLPSTIWDRIECANRPDSRWKLFPARQLALSALSDACVSYGRSLASLPPLNANTPAG